LKATALVPALQVSSTIIAGTTPRIPGSRRGSRAVGGMNPKRELRLPIIYRREDGGRH